MDNLKKIIIVLVIILIIAIGILILIVNNNESDSINETDGTEMTEEEIAENIETEQAIKELTSYYNYYSVIDCLDLYMEYSSDNTSLDNIIPEFVKEELGLSTESLSQYVGINEGTIIIDTIYQSRQTFDTEAYEETTNIQAYIVNGYIVNDDISEFTVIVITDEINVTFAIIPQIYIEEKNMDLSIGTNLVIYEDEQIDTNDYNVFSATMPTQEQICKIYEEHYKNLELYYPEKAYELLDEEYRELRFPTYEEFLEYIELNKTTIENGTLSKYSCEYLDEYTECVLVTSYNYTYTVHATSVMNYTIQLDNYTITVDTYEEDYSESSDEEKIEANIYIFIQMINSKDYEGAYALLDETFKANNFATEEAFEEYMQNNWYSYNLIVDTTITSEGNTYICSVTLKEGSSSIAEKTTKTIIMQLLDDTDFVMSFTID